MHVDKGGSRFFGEGLGQHGLATAGGSIEQNSLGCAQQSRGTGEQVWVVQWQDDTLTQRYNNRVQSSDL